MKRENLQRMWRGALAVLVALPLVVLLVVTGGGKAWADDLGLSVAPATQRVNLDPGEGFSGVVEFRNVSPTSSAKMRVYATPFYSSGNDYENTDFSDANPFTQLSCWISFKQSEYTLAPGEIAKVVYTAKVPPKASPGGQYAAIMGEIENPGSADTGASGATTVRRVASLIYARISGSAQVAGEVVNREIPRFVWGGDLKTSFAVQNSGNVDFKVIGNLTVKPIVGLGSYTSPQDVKGQTVLPDTTRTVALDWQDPGIGLFTVSQMVVLNGMPQTVSQWTLICPIWLIIAAAVVLLLLVCLVVFSVVRRRRRRRRFKGQIS